MQTHTYRGRFAPSPTGPLHFGSLIAAVGSYLQTRSQRGKWLLRIEDIDPPREVEGAADGILHTLETHGLLWDEPVLYQSQRSERYLDALSELKQAGFVYPCTCSRRTISGDNSNFKMTTVYPGTCRQRRNNEKHQHLLRVLTTAAHPIYFEDAIVGTVEAQLEQEVGDFVVRRADGLFSYQLAVAIDDADQNISEVVRGNDLLDSTPRQIHIHNLLGLVSPQYAHLPVATDIYGNKFSKQTQSQALDSNAPGLNIHNALAFLGQHPPKELASAPLDEVWQWALAHWKLERVPATQRIVVAS